MRLVLGVIVLVTGCAPRAPTLLPPGAADAGVELCAPCASWGNPRNAGTVSDRLVELSGLVASRAHPGVLYAHNDSGDTARFFAMSSSTLSEYTLTGATNVDWEDVALGPCPAGTCLYLGDIGDNRRVRSDYAVYRVTEPPPGAGGVTTVAWEKLAYQYPGGVKHNAESLLVHPKTGRVFIITKEDPGLPSEVYRFPSPLDPANQVTLEKVAALTVPTPADAMLTGASVHPCGHSVLLRMYNRVVELRLADAGAEFETIFALEPVTVTTPQEPQGEAVAYSADGRSYFTASEKLTEPVTLYEMRCK